MINLPDRIRPAEAAAVEALRAAGVSDPQRDARLLMRWALELSAEDYAAAADAPLRESAARRLADGVAARAARRPLSHITGRRSFFGREFRIGPGALDPRPESETLVAAALTHLDRLRAPSPRVLDLGVGSGCLLLSVLAERTAARGLGVDASDAALALAAENARALDLDARAQLARGDWLQGIDARFEAILCNPPYIPVADMAALAPEVRLYEPRAALTDEADGLTAYRRIGPNLARTLAPGGAAFFEMARGADAKVASLFESLGHEVETLADLDGAPRVAVVRPHAAAAAAAAPGAIA